MGISTEGSSVLYYVHCPLRPWSLTLTKQTIRKNRSTVQYNPRWRVTSRPRTQTRTGTPSEPPYFGCPPLDTETSRWTLTCLLRRTKNPLLLLQLWIPNPILGVFGVRYKRGRHHFDYKNKGRKKKDRDG